MAAAIVFGVMLVVWAAFVWLVERPGARRVHSVPFVFVRFMASTKKMMAELRQLDRQMVALGKKLRKELEGR